MYRELDIRVAKALGWTDIDITIGESKGSDFGTMWCKVLCKAYLICVEEV
jgi:hypothetical protein